MVNNNLFKIKCERILKELVKKGFPELRKENMNIKIVEKAPWRAYANPFPWRKVIFLDNKLANYGLDKIKGTLIHELCHFSIYKRRGTFWIFYDYLLSSISKMYQRRLEWEVDELAIKKGYGKYLLITKKNQTKKQKEGYMSLEDVLRLMKENDN
jgi:hypothetical protein